VCGSASRRRQSGRMHQLGERGSETERRRFKRSEELAGGWVDGGRGVNGAVNASAESVGRL
jgi:hypothetical protein